MALLIALHFSEQWNNRHALPFILGRDVIPTCLSHGLIGPAWKYGILFWKLASHSSSVLLSSPLSEQTCLINAKPQNSNSMNSCRMKKKRHQFNLSIKKSINISDLNQNIFFLIWKYFIAVWNIFFFLSNQDMTLNKCKWIN